MSERPVFEALPPRKMLIMTEANDGITVEVPINGHEDVYPADTAVTPGIYLPIIEGEYVDKTGEQQK